MTRRLGLDFGTKRLGLAFADGELVRPFEVWSRKDMAQDIAYLKRVIEDYDIGELVVGLPTQLDGTITPATERARAFVEALRTSLSVPIKEWDEALSSFEADQRMEEAGVPRKERKQHRDAFAAMVILEDFLS